jgi:hypothetical protein
VRGRRRSRARSAGRGRDRGHLQPAAAAARSARRGPRAEPGAGRGDRDRQRLGRRDCRGGAQALSVRPAGRADAQHRRRGRVRLRHGAGPGQRRGPHLVHGRRHGTQGGRAAGAAGRPRTLPGRAPRAGRQPGDLDRRTRSPDEHPAPQAVRQPGRTPGGCDRGLPADPFGIVRLDPGGGRGMPSARPAAGGLLPVERRLRVHHPAAARPGRPALPGQRGRAQDGQVRLDRLRPRGALLLRGQEQDLDVQGSLAARARRASGVRRLDAAPLGTHLGTLA